MSEVEETLKRINSHKGVQGIVIINSDGIPIRSTLEQTLSTNYAAHIMSLASKARSAVRTLDPQNDLTFLRIRSKKHEIMVAPEKVRAAGWLSRRHAHGGSERLPPHETHRDRRRAICGREESCEDSTSCGYTYRCT